MEPDVRLEDLNRMAPADAERALLRCCGSQRWARLMTVARPFAGAEAMAAASDAIWVALDRADWLEAFAAHPRIGDPAAARAGTPDGPSWAAEEQSGVTARSRARFEQLNRRYEDRFGYIFIVCATGRSAAEMQAMLERRMTNDPDDELGEAAEEQRQITRLRLARLLT